MDSKNKSSGSKKVAKIIALVAIILALTGSATAFCVKMGILPIPDFLKFGISVDKSSEEYDDDLMDDIREFSTEVEVETEIETETEAEKQTETDNKNVADNKYDDDFVNDLRFAANMTDNTINQSIVNNDKDDNNL